MAAKWPTSVATDADLYVAVNSLQTTLSTTMNASVTSVVLASATGFPTAGAVTIDNEVIFYTNISGSTLTGCTRGSDGTTAASHNSGVPVGASIVAFHHNGLMSEIEAIETDINARFGRGASSNTIVIPSAVTFAFATASNKAFVAAAAQATADRTWTIPDIAGDGTFAALEGTQTFSGSKTFSAVTTLFTAARTDTQGNCPVLLSASQKYGFRIDTGNIFNIDAFNGSSWTTPFVITGTGDVKVTGNTSPNLYVVSSSGSGVQVRILASTTSAGYIQTQTNHPLYFTTNNGVNAIEITTSQAVNIRGTQTNDSAAAGFVGQYIESVVSTLTSFPSTGNYGDLTSISLTAGDWDVSLQMVANANGATSIVVSCGIGTTSGNSTTSLVSGSNWVENAVGPVSGSTQSNNAIAPYRISVSGTTTVYFKYEASFGTATPKAAGRISARRVR